MKFGYTIIYVADVEATISFYEKAFGLTRRFVHEMGYGELETGTTTLAFASHEMGASNLPNGYEKIRPHSLPMGFEIALVADDVAVAYEKAVAIGATALSPPQAKPWGQIVAYVRDLNGVVIEICSAIEN